MLNTRFLCLFISVLSVLGFSGCASKTLIRDSEYQPTYKALEQSDFKEAVRVYPEQKEKNGFITTFEKNWLKFWNPEADKKDADKKNSIAELQRISSQLDERQLTRVSYETSVFFVGESEDGYMPSEHEMVALKLLLAMYYIQENKKTEASVEMRKAVDLLNRVTEKGTTFDDPALRL